MSSRPKKGAKQETRHDSLTIETIRYLTPRSNVGNIGKTFFDSILILTAEIAEVVNDHKILSIRNARVELVFSLSISSVLPRFYIY